jgi:N-acetylneuraminic acid mutarotase
MSSWVSAPSVLQPHQSMGAAAIGNAFSEPIAFSLRLFVVGGSGASGDVEMLSPASMAPPVIHPEEWTAVSSLITPRFGHAVAIGSNSGVTWMYAIGGRSNPGGTNPSGTLLSSVEGYALGPPNNGRWTAMASMPVARERAAAAGLYDMVYVAGGSDGSAPNISSPLKTLEAYQVSTNTWKKLKHMHTARDGAAAAAGTDGRIYVMGGRGASGSMSSVEAYDPTTNTWEKVASMNTPRDGLGAVLADGQIYAIGGENNAEVLSTVEVYNFTTKTWTLGPSMSTARAYLAAALGPGELIYAIGGYTGASVTNSVEALSV